jgi:hypothetical protein
LLFARTVADEAGGGDDSRGWGRPFDGRSCSRCGVRWSDEALKIILMPKGRKLTPSAKPSDLFEDIRPLIEQARAATARAINSAVT